MTPFEFIGFRAPQSLASLASQKLFNLLTALPDMHCSKAVMVLHPTRTFEGEIILEGPFGIFKAHAKGKQAKQVLQELYRRLKGQLVNWELGHPSLIQLLRQQSRPYRHDPSGGGLQAR